MLAESDEYRGLCLGFIRSDLSLSGAVEMQLGLFFARVCVCVFYLFYFILLFLFVCFCFCFCFFFVLFFLFFCFFGGLVDDVQCASDNHIEIHFPVDVECLAWVLPTIADPLVRFLNNYSLQFLRCA